MRESLIRDEINDGKKPTSWFRVVKEKECL